MSEFPQFHPEIEKVFETHGEDLGRVKDIEIAEDTAHTMNDNRNFMDLGGLSVDPKDTSLENDVIKREIVERAVTEKARKIFSDDIAFKVSNGHVKKGDSVFVQNEHVDQLKDKTEALHEEAWTVSEEYDTLQRMASRAQNAREEDR